MTDKVRILDFDTRQIKEIDSIELTPELVEINKQTSNPFQNYKIVFKGNVEELCAKYYKSLGYTCMKLTPYAASIAFPKEVLEKIKEINPKISKPDILLTLPGVPDFLVFRKNEENIVELFFVECKSKADSLNQAQMLWAFLYAPLKEFIFWREDY